MGLAESIIDLYEAFTIDSYKEVLQSAVSSWYQDDDRKRVLKYIDREDTSFERQKMLNELKFDDTAIQTSLLEDENNILVKIKKNIEIALLVEVLKSENEERKQSVVTETYICLLHYYLDKKIFQEDTSLREKIHQSFPFIFMSMFKVTYLIFFFENIEILLKNIEHRFGHYLNQILIESYKQKVTINNEVRVLNIFSSSILDVPKDHIKNISSTNVKWNGTAIDFVELITALDLANCITDLEGKKLPRIKLAEYFKTFFNFDDFKIDLFDDRLSKRMNNVKTNRFVKKLDKLFDQHIEITKSKDL